jgi:hypothetical protein
VMSNKNKQPDNNNKATTAGIHLASERADAVLAAVGAAGSLALLQVLNDAYQIPLVGSFLMSSSVKFFFNPTPPSLDAFCKSSAFAVVAGSVWHLIFKEIGAHASSCMVFCIVLFWKLEGCLWTAANTLAIFIAVSSGDWDASSFQNFPIHYIISPYITGHLVLYGCALGMAVVRRRVRSYLLRRDFFSAFSYMRHDNEKLQLLFDRMDTSGDGRLDVVELQLALRAALHGADISLEDCKDILRSVDTDGDGTLNFHEFRAAVDKIMLL